ncbi:hypothetical protein, partial [Bacteroides cellulosilyticus]|uniref:hypothetical protein n=1 Tax=Bacteroides cellulosilyticus TaxID=246787 RepID=UPI001E4F6AEB
CLIYAFVRSVHVIILRHPACISFTNRSCSFCLHSMFIPLTSDIFSMSTYVVHVLHIGEAARLQL